MGLPAAAGRLRSSFSLIAVTHVSLSAAFAAEIAVTNPGDLPTSGSLTLREAVGASAPSDVVTFAVAQPVVLTEGEIVIDHDLTIKGPDLGTQTIQRRGETTPFRLFNVTQGTITLSHLTLRNGYVAVADINAPPSLHDAQGGAILNAGTLTLSECYFSGNSVNAGNGIAGDSGETGGDGEGGAIYNAGTLVATGCTFDGNVAAGGAGGTSTTGPGAPAGLSAGGAIHNIGMSTVSNCTFSGNAAVGLRGGGSAPNEVGGKGGAAQGGAVFNAGVLEIGSSTFSQNGAQAGQAGPGDILPDDNGGDAAGGAIFSSDDPSVATTLRSSIVARSIIFGGSASSGTPGKAEGRNVFGPIASAGFNLIQDASDSSGWVASDQIGTAATPIDPLLQTFAHDNGGTTPTYSLKPGSPAIDQGFSPGLTNDQRGLARTFDDPAVANAAGGEGSDVGAFELQPAPPAILQNISTRARVETGDNVLIGGLIVNGQAEKTILFRAIGADVPVNLATLVDPVLELHGPNGELIATNNNWADTQQAEIELVNLAPIVPNDAALLIDLMPNSYTAIVRGQDGGSGIALVEAYDLSGFADATMANISSRGHVGAGDDVLIAGFILGGGGGGATRVAVRALGPSLGFGANGLQDPTIELYDGDGVFLGSNDNWKDTQEQEISAAGLAPGDDAEATLIMTLPPADYTAIVRSKDETTGIALVEVYRLE